MLLSKSKFNSLIYKNIKKRILQKRVRINKINKNNKNNENNKNNKNNKNLNKFIIQTTNPKRKIDK